MLPTPALSDLVELWLQGTGYRLEESYVSKNVWRITGGLSDSTTFGWVHDVERPFVYIIINNTGGEMLTPADPEFFNKIASRLGIKDGRTAPS